MKRVNISISREIDEYYTLESERIGMSKSALMAYALMEHMKQNSTLKAMSEIMKHYENDPKK